jgi:uncharacterized membrane protein YccC
MAVDLDCASLPSRRIGVDEPQRIPRNSPWCGSFCWSVRVRRSGILVGNARDWIAAHRAEITLSLRITVAGLIALAIGELLGVRQVYWAVLTAVIVMQASVGGSLKATMDRLAGTVAGALWGALLGVVIPHPGTLATAGLLAVALLPLAALVAWWPSFRVAPVTAIIVLLVPHGEAGPVQAATERLIEIALGCAVALGVALAITPSRAHGLLSAAAADALTPMREQILLLLAGITEPVHPAAVIALHDRIRGAIERCAAAAADAGRERNSYLTTAPDPDPLVRSLRRISDDLIMLARALPKPLLRRLCWAAAYPLRPFKAERTFPSRQAQSAALIARSAQHNFAYEV